MEECPCVSPGPEKQMPRWDEMFKGFIGGNAYKRAGVELEKAVRATRLSCWFDLCGRDRAGRKEEVLRLQCSSKKIPSRLSRMSLP